MMPISAASAGCLVLFLSLVSTWCCSGFQPPAHYNSAAAAKPSSRTATSSTASRMNTVIDAPTKEDLERKVGRRSGGNEQENGDFLGDAEDNVADAIRKQGPLEWLEDNPDEVRDMDDPFHILVLDTTFEKPAITVPYLATNLEYVLSMPKTDANEHAQWCYENGMSCVGVWPREECLTLGRQLQLRDIVCRVVPYCEGGHRGWQANKDADATHTGGFFQESAEP